MRPVIPLVTGLLVGATIAAAAGGSARAADLAGTWGVSATFVSGGRIVSTATPLCTFQQTGDRISGTCKGPNALGPSAGTVEGAAVAWQWNHTATTPYGLTGSTGFRGELGADGVIRGTATSSNLPGLVGTFTEQRR